MVRKPISSSFWFLAYISIKPYHFRFSPIQNHPVQITYLVSLSNILFSGRILTGVVRKQKMQRTIIVRRDYLHFVKKYGRFEKRHNVSILEFFCLTVGENILISM